MNSQLCEVSALTFPRWQTSPLSPPIFKVSNPRASPCSTTTPTSAPSSRMVLPPSPAQTCQESVEPSHPLVFHPTLPQSQALSLPLRALSVRFLHDLALLLQNDSEDVKKPWQRRWGKVSSPISKIWSACKVRWQKMPLWKPCRRGSTIRNTRLEE